MSSDTAFDPISPLLAPNNDQILDESLGIQGITPLLLRAVIEQTINNSHHVFSLKDTRDLVAELTNGRMTPFTNSSGVTITPLMDGHLALSFPPGQTSRNPDAVTSINGPEIAGSRSYQERFGKDFTNSAQAYCADIIRRINESKVLAPEEQLVTGLLKTNFDGTSIAVILPKESAYLLHAGGMLQGIVDDYRDQLFENQKVIGAIIVDPILTKDHQASCRTAGFDPKKHFAQVVTHFDVDTFPIMIADLEYPGPAMKKALYAAIIYAAAYGAENRFPLHASAICIKTKTGELGLITTGASGAGKTETWSNLIYALSHYKELAFTTPKIREMKKSFKEEMSKVFSKPFNFGNLMAQLRKTQIEPAGDDIFMVTAENNEVPGVNIENQALFLRPDTQASIDLVDAMLNRSKDSDVVYMNYPKFELGGRVDITQFESNPRIFFPTNLIPDGRFTGRIDVHVLNIGMRCSQWSEDAPGLCAGLLHVLDTDIATLLNLDLPRATKGNPSIGGAQSHSQITGEGPGSESGFIIPEAFAPVYQKLFDVYQAMGQSGVKFVSTASQNVGAITELEFAGLNVLELLLANPKNSEKMLAPENLISAGHPLLGKVPRELKIGNNSIRENLIHPWKQDELGIEGWIKTLTVLNNHYIGSITTFLDSNLNKLQPEVVDFLNDWKSRLNEWSKPAKQEIIREELAAS